VRGHVCVGGDGRALPRLHTLRARASSVGRKPEWETVFRLIYGTRAATASSSFVASALSSGALQVYFAEGMDDLYDLQLPTRACLRAACAFSYPTQVWLAHFSVIVRPKQTRRLHIRLQGLILPLLGRRSAACSTRKEPEQPRPPVDVRRLRQPNACSSESCQGRRVSIRKTVGCLQLLCSGIYPIMHTDMHA
jgi:hypothetical protein